MGCALVRPLIFDSHTNLENIRAMAHKELDKFIDLLAPLLEKKATPTLQEMSAHFMQTRSALLGGIMKTLTEVLMPRAPAVIPATDHRYQSRAEQPVPLLLPESSAMPIMRLESLQQASADLFVTQVSLLFPWFGQRHLQIYLSRQRPYSIVITELKKGAHHGYDCYFKNRAHRCSR